MKSNPKILLEKKSNEKVDQIISKNTSKHILKLLRAVIQETEFTGPKVNIEGYDIGGKTGTAELIDKSGNYNKNANRTIFVGAFPMFDPKYLIVTVINNPQKIKEHNFSTTSSTVNAPFVKKIISFIKFSICEKFNILKFFLVVKIVLKVSRSFLRNLQNRLFLPVMIIFFLFTDEKTIEYLLYFFLLIEFLSYDSKQIKIFFYNLIF